MSRIASRLFGRLQKLVWRQLSKRSPSENAFLALIPAVGAATGLAALGIAYMIAWLESVCWGPGGELLAAVSETPWWGRIAILTLGGLIVGWIGRWFAVQTRGSGTSEMIHSLAMKGGYISLRKTVPRVFAGIVTVAMGGSLGREGPMTQLAGAMGSWAGRWAKLSKQQVRILVCSAAAAAIAAVYNAPIGGTILAMEMLIGNFSLEVFGPVVIASVISTLIFRNAMGDLPRFVIPAYEMVSGWELLGYLVLGILGGIVSVLFVRVLFWIEDAFNGLRVPVVARPAIGMALVGGIGCAFPHVFGNGFDTVNLTLHEQLPLYLLLVLPLAKLVATALTLGAGGAGGLFMPTLMIGALLGGAFGYGVHAWFPDTTAEHGAYALVGMGAVLAGTTHAPITAILMIFEQTDSYRIILPLMLVCIISTAVARLLKADSVYLETLRRRGVILPRGPEESLMQNLRVSDLMHTEVESVPARAPFGLIVDRFLRSPHNNLYVVDDEGRFLGAVPLHALKDMLHQREGLDVVIAQDLLDETFDFVTPNMRLADTMDKFWRRQCERLPVVDTAERRKLVGWISKRDLIGIYHQEILKKRPLMGRFSVAQAEGRKDVFVELPEGFVLQTAVVHPSMSGRTLRELELRTRYNVHVLQIKRRDPLSGTAVIEMPGPESPLQAGDELVVIGTVVDIARLMSDAAIGIEKPAG